MTYDIAALFDSHGRLRTDLGGRFGALDVVSPKAVARTVLPWLLEEGLHFSGYHNRYALLLDEGTPPKPVDRAKLAEVLRVAVADLLRGVNKPEATDTARMLERQEQGHSAYINRVLLAAAADVPWLDGERTAALGKAISAQRAERRLSTHGEPYTRDEWNAERRVSRQSARDVRIKFSRREVAALVDSLEPGRHAFSAVWKRYDGELGRNDFYAALAEAVPAKKHAGVRYLIVSAAKESVDAL